jgi:hypothetical protein
MYDGVSAADLLEAERFDLICSISCCRVRMGLN